MPTPLHHLNSSALRDLVAALVDGPLSQGISAHAVQQIAGSCATPDVLEELKRLLTGGWSLQQIGTLASAIVDARDQAVDVERLFDLVLSGPDVPGVPTRDTAAVMHTLVEDAQQEVLLVGYAVYNGQKLFARLAQKMAAQPALSVRFCLNIARGQTDTSLDSEIVRRFAREFFTRHWPWEHKPELYYDPRALQRETPVRASLHAKCLLVDRKAALITSANFTEAAQERNIEAGVVITYPPFVQRLGRYFDTLGSSVFRPCPLAG